MPVEIKGEKFFNVQEVAAELRCTAQTVRKYIKLGELNAKRIGRPLLISEKNFNQYIKH
jgi:excisionase family DNA binding protein